MSEALRQALFAQYTEHRAGASSCTGTIWSHSPKSGVSFNLCHPIQRFGVSSKPMAWEAPSAHVASNRWRAARRGSAGAARGAQLRGRVCQQPLALGFPSWLAQSADAARRVADAIAARRPRRPFRLACHLQWYLAETAENVAHGLSQANQKRGLPRAAMSDNGAAMTAAEISEGLARLGILHQTTLPYSPYQNAKQEAFWGPVEGRLMAMLEDMQDLTLATLNEATQAWVEYDYNRKIHSEIGEPPISRFIAGPTVTRPSPDSATLKLAFTRTERRTLRKSDGTIAIEGRRFEAPNRYRHFTRLEIRFASWDLTLVHLVDDQTGMPLCRLFPQDKTKNASGLRRSLDPISAEPIPAKSAGGMAPLLAKLIDQQTATGLPAAYLPKDEGDES